jgi:hypothetical protein
MRGHLEKLSVDGNTVLKPSFKRLCMCLCLKLLIGFKSLIIGSSSEVVATVLQKVGRYRPAE